MHALEMLGQECADFSAAEVVEAYLHDRLRLRALCCSIDLRKLDQVVKAIEIHLIPLLQLTGSFRHCMQIAVKSGNFWIGEARQIVARLRAHYANVSSPDCDPRS